MSATRDKSQKIAFVYSNFYKIYKDSQNAQTGAPAPDFDPSQASLALSSKGQVIKAEDLHAQADVRPAPMPDLTPRAFRPGLRIDQPAVSIPSGSPAAPAAPKVEELRPVSFIGKRVARPATLPENRASTEAVQSLRQNLQTLQDLHSRLKVMLKDLEELGKE